jgi:hypothetical protein
LVIGAWSLPFDWSLVLGHCRLIGHWCLVFAVWLVIGAWSLPFDWSLVLGHCRLIGHGCLVIAV